MSIAPLLTIPALALTSLAVVAGPAGASPVAGRNATPTKAVAAPTTRTPATCKGQPATVVPAYTTYDGTAEVDVLVVLGGAEVYAGFGDDIICVYGDEFHGATVYASYGDDQITAYSGTHTLLGQEGNDTIVANGGYMEVDGGEDADIINVGGATHADVWGGHGNDIINGSPGDDVLYGGAGNDLVLGWGGADTVYGDEGDDDLRGGAGWDGHSGGIGTDSCSDGALAPDGGMFGECENITATPAAAGGFATT